MWAKVRRRSLIVVGLVLRFVRFFLRLVGLLVGLVLRLIGLVLRLLRLLVDFSSGLLGRSLRRLVRTAARRSNESDRHAPRIGSHARTICTLRTTAYGSEIRARSGADAERAKRLTRGPGSDAPPEARHLDPSAR